MSSLVSVPFTTVDRRNFESIFPEIEKCIRNSHYVSLDLELSGIGPKGVTRDCNLNERYLSNKSLAETRGVLSLGLSTFRYIRERNDRTKIRDANGINPAQFDDADWCLRTAVFNIYCKPPGDYVQDEEAREFLGQHNFDFDRQNQFGVPYYKEWHEKPQCHTQLSVNRVFDIIVRSKKPIVVHNGFLDLAFLYECFFGPLPTKVGIFCAHLKKLFPSGIYDTKFLTIVTKLDRSFLEYIFYDQQRQNLLKMRNMKRSVFFAFDNIKHVPVDESVPHEQFFSRKNMFTHPLLYLGEKICRNYVHNNGWCPDGTHCKDLHAADAILDIKEMETCAYHRGEEKKLESLKSLKKLCFALCRRSGVEDLLPEVDADDTDLQGDRSNDLSHAHNAASDAFMTGYSFACFVNHLDRGSRNFKNYVNRIFVTGLKEPFFVRGLEYTDISQIFEIKLNAIMGNSPSQ